MDRYWCPEQSMTRIRVFVYNRFSIGIELYDLCIYKYKLVTENLQLNKKLFRHYIIYVCEVLILLMH